MNWSAVAASAPRPPSSEARGDLGDDDRGEKTPTASAARDIDELTASMSQFPSLAASSSSARSSAAGLDNQGSSYNCFLNAVVQSLRLTASFGDKLVAWWSSSAREAGENGDDGAVAVARELAALCAALASAAARAEQRGAAASGHRTVVSPAALRRALAAKASSSGVAFEEEAMADAGEALSALLDAVSSSSIGGRALVDAQFGLTLRESVQCSSSGCGSRCELRGGDPLPTQHVFLLPSAALRASAEDKAARNDAGGGERDVAPRNTLSAALASSLAQERSCPACGTPGARLATSLFRGREGEEPKPLLPDAVAVQIVWESSSPPAEEVRATLAGLAESFDVADVVEGPYFGEEEEGVEAEEEEEGGEEAKEEATVEGGDAPSPPPPPPPPPKPKPSTVYGLRAAVCFYGSHYTAALRCCPPPRSLSSSSSSKSPPSTSSSAYDAVDDASRARRVGDFRDLLASWSRGKVQPAVLLFERGLGGGGGGERASSAAAAKEPKAADPSSLSPSTDAAPAAGSGWAAIASKPPPPRPPPPPPPSEEEQQQRQREQRRQEGGAPERGRGRGGSGGGRGRGGGAEGADRRLDGGGRGRGSGGVQRGSFRGGGGRRRGAARNE